MQRFYSNVSVDACDDKFCVLLDGKAIKTPAKNPLHLPCEPLAKLVAQEWDSQEEEIEPKNMPFMRLSATAIDRVSVMMEETVAEIGKYVGSDLLCYRASAPTELVLRQQARWDPLLDWARQRYDVSLEVTQGIMHVAQSEETCSRLMQAAGQCEFGLTALAHATAVSGSAIIALALKEGFISAQDAYEASCLDHLFQQDVWGEDAEEKARLTNISLELKAVTLYFQALSDQ